MSYKRARWTVIAPALLIAASSLRGDEPSTIASNLEYRLAWGDLGSPGTVVLAPPESRRAVRLTHGGEELLQLCANNPGRWQKDPLLFRFGHSHPGSTIGCRERTSPSVHVVFYRRPGDSREAWVHFDLHGPNNVIAHIGEVARNRMTFGRTSQHEVFRGLVRTNPDGSDLVPRPKYHFTAQGRQYLHKAFGYNAAGMAVASAAGSTALGKTTGWGLGGVTYQDRVYTNLARNAVAQSIEFGTAAFLQQDQGFASSTESGFGRRARSALYRSFFVRGRHGDELAFPRIAAALATPHVMAPWHPAGQAAPDPWVQSALMLSRSIARSYWAEFKPDIKRATKKLISRNSHRTGKTKSIPGVSEVAMEADPSR